MADEKPERVRIHEFWAELNRRGEEWVREKLLHRPDWEQDGRDQWARQWLEMREVRARQEDMEERRLQHREQLQQQRDQYEGQAEMQRSNLRTQWVIVAVLVFTLLLTGYSVLHEGSSEFNVVLDGYRIDTGRSYNHIFAFRVANDGSKPCRMQEILRVEVVSPDTAITYGLRWRGGREGLGLNPGDQDLVYYVEDAGHVGKLLRNHPEVALTIYFETVRGDLQLETHTVSVTVRN